MAWFPKKTVLVPIDLGEGSMAALSTARDLTGDAGKVHALHVLGHLSAVDPGVMFGKVTDESRTQKATATVAKRLAEAGFADVEVAIRIGSPPKEIVAYAKAIGAELIVMPARGQHALEAFNVGSTATRVVALAPCPVLVTK